ncbi:MAG: helix-turn-helix domain-containing protein [Marinovum sp.]|nr:helix-turn-helix domain-containing protein [Marinovum sp.]
MNEETAPRIDFTPSMGVAILEALAGLKQGMSVCDISRALGLTEASACHGQSTVDFYRR